MSPTFRYGSSGHTTLFCHRGGYIIAAPRADYRMDPGATLEPADKLSA